jgi:TolB-like protein
MISSISYLDKVIVILFSVLLLFSGCANTQEATRRDFHPPSKNYPIAVFPVENLSRTIAPLKEIRESFINTLKADGFEVLEEERLEKFMAKHRIRYVGGLDSLTAQAFKKETGTEAVLITSLELYNEIIPPKIALTARLVSTGDRTNILWMDGVGMAGDDSPGILGLGLIEDPRQLLKKALGFLSHSLLGYLISEKGGTSVKSPKRKFQPKVYFLSPEIRQDKKYTVAVLPFLNWSDRINAGEIVALQFVKELTKLEDFDVIEFGVVRQRLLNARVIMDEGISLPDVDNVANYLMADLIFTGKVMNYEDYQGTWGVPKVDFFISAIERKSRKIVWTSNSYNQGNDKVYLFDWGRVNTAYAMTSQMMRWIGEMILEDSKRAQGVKHSSGQGK